MILVKKKDGSCRLCMDYHKLNSVTIQDAYPHPRIDDYLGGLAGSKYFGTLNLLSGYWQVLFSLMHMTRQHSSFSTSFRNGRFCHLD